MAGLLRCARNDGIRVFVFLTFLACSIGAQAQDAGTLNPKPLPPLANPADPALPAKELFGRRATPANMAPKPVGFYSRGCLAGADMLPIDGDAWQVMRLSRNRNWGHPELVAFLMRVAREARAQNIWPGLLVGDMSQPRGGPMLSGHASHQIGLDADVWFTPMPKRRLSREEREEMSATNLVREDWLDIDPTTFNPRQIALLKLVAQKNEVERIFVNPAIKKAICRDVRGDRAWLSKIRPIYGHNYHFHIRLSCPSGEEACRAQEPPPQGDGCDKTLDWWFTEEAMNPKPAPPAKPVTLAQLPPACRAVLEAK
jgi:penicillin-insensitive murein DD-endopeptidase